MSAVFKGRQSPSLISEEPAFDAESGTTQFDQTFAGSKAAIFAMAAQFEDDNISYQVSNSGPVYIITARVPQNSPANPDRYEIFTESQDNSIFEHPIVLADAETFDATIAGSGADSYRKRAEDAVEVEDIGPTSTWQQVVRHLKAGVTGFQVDFLVLRRFRQIDLNYASGAGVFNLSSGSFIYSTAQLNLPASVTFSLPATPASPSADYDWGWRMRGQRVDLVGIYAEQTIELVFAPWSNLLYEVSAGALNW